MPFEPKFLHVDQHLRLEMSDNNFIDTPSETTISDVKGDLNLLNDPAGANLYNFIKSIAKEPIKEIGYEKLYVFIEGNKNIINEKNSRGSTGLHACGYLKRWDLADILLKKGADPSIRNFSGHSFFLTAVKSLDAPWKELFSDHPELIKKHEKYLTRRNKNLQKKDKQRVVEDKKESSLDASESFLEQEDLARAMNWESLVDVIIKTGRVNVSLEHRNLFLKKSPWNLIVSVASLIGSLSEAECSSIIERLWSNECELESVAAIAQTLSHTKRTEQVSCFERAVKSKSKEHLVFFLKTNWMIEQDLIEECEDLGLYDFADLLIDKSLSKVVINVDTLPKKSKKPVKKNELKGVTSTINKTKKKPKPKRKSNHGKSSHSASKIANFDNPQRDVSDFDYKEKKAVPAPIIIIKKARTLRPEINE